MTPRRLLALALLGPLVGCAGGEPSPSASTTRPSSPGLSTASPSANPIPPTVTPEDDGGTFTMTVGASSELVISDPDAPDPVITGAAIDLIPIVNVTDSGGREWELRAVAPGSTTIRGSSPEFELTITVTP